MTKIHAARYRGGTSETPERLIVLIRGLEEAGLLSNSSLYRPLPRNSTGSRKSIHPSYIYSFAEACTNGLNELGCADNRSARNPTKRPCWQLAASSNRSTCLMEGNIDNVFCAVRPSRPPCRDGGGARLLLLQ